MTTFYRALDNVGSSTSGYTAGSGSLALAAGSGAAFGTPSAGSPVLVSTFLADGTPKGVYQVTGRTVDTLTGLSLVAGTDSSLPAGSPVLVNWTAEAANQITAAVSAAEATITAQGGSITANAAAISLRALDSAAVHNTGTESISGLKTFVSIISGSITGNAGTVTNGVVSTGSYADPAWLTSLSTAKLSGIVPTANLGTGTANGTTFLRGDNTWATVSGSGAPGGTPGQLQTNTAGAFGGMAGSTVSATGALLTVQAQLATDKPLVCKGATQTATITNVAQVTTAATITTATPHGFTPGAPVVISGLSHAALNGTWAVSTVPLSTTFTFALPTGTIASVADAGTATVAQYASLQEWQSSTGFVFAKIQGDGYIVGNPSGGGQVKIGPFPGQPQYGGIWFGSATPTGSNYSFLSDGSSGTFFNDGSLIGFKVSNNQYAALVSGMFCVGYNLSAADGDATTALISVASGPTIKPIVAKAAASQSADLVALWNASKAVLYGFDKLGRPYSGNTTPTIAAGTGAGTGPTVSVAGTDCNGIITILTGTTPAASAIIATVSFSAAYAAAPKTVFLQPADTLSAALTGAGRCFVDDSATTTGGFALKVGSSALVASTTYRFKFLVMG